MTRRWGARWAAEDLAGSPPERRRDRSKPILGPGPVVREIDGRELLNLASNDYLSLAARPVTGCSGATGSRLITGTHAVHRDVERALAEWLSQDDALLFSSGYAANLGTVAALCRSEDCIFSDQLNHASLIDGCRLSRAQVQVYRHLDVQHLGELLATKRSGARAWVLTESYFSMDGDLPPLAELSALCERWGAALLVDEAHALGVWGPAGGGALAASGTRADITTGAFGKAFGAAGGFVAADQAVVDWLWQRARSQVFSTAGSPAVVQAVGDHLEEIRAGGLTERLHQNVRVFRDALQRRAVPVLPSSRGPIIPVLIGADDRAVGVQRGLLERGVYVYAVRPPTVPPGTARLRLTVQVGHETAQLVAAAEHIADVLGDGGGTPGS